MVAPQDKKPEEKQEQPQQQKKEEEKQAEAEKEEQQVEIDSFEEFEKDNVGIKITLEDERRDLWQAEWDDEDVEDDFHVRLRDELQARG